MRSLPEEEQEAVAVRILDQLRRCPARKGRWAKVAEELTALDLFHGRSGDLERHVREFWDGSGFRDPPRP
jgi:hypothetical protein